MNSLFYLYRSNGCIIVFQEHNRNHLCKSPLILAIVLHRTLSEYDSNSTTQRENKLIWAQIDADESKINIFSKCFPKTNKCVFVIGTSLSDPQLDRGTSAVYYMSECISPGARKPSQMSNVFVSLCFIQCSFISTKVSFVTVYKRPFHPHPSRKKKNRCANPN